MGGGLTAPALTTKDMDDVKTAAQLEADYLAVSFPKSKEDMYMARQLLRAAGGRAMLIAKIERAEAITALEEIIDASDGIMVARGDLAVEVGNAAVPGLQKRMIRVGARAQQADDHRDADDGVDDPQAGARRAPRCPTSPTRCSTAPTPSCCRPRRPPARYPVETVETMAQICVEAEKSDPVQLDRDFLEPHVHAHRPVDRDGDAVHRVSPAGQGDRLADRFGVDGAVDVAAQLRLPDLRADAEGRDAAARWRSTATSRRCSSSRAPTATRCCARPRSCCSRKRQVQRGDLIVLTIGEPMGKSGGTNTMKIVRVGRPRRA